MEVDSSPSWTHLVLISLYYVPGLCYSFKLSLCPAHFLPVSMLMYYVCVLSGSVMSNSLWLYGLKPARFLCPWNFPDKNTGVGCHFLLQGIFPTLGSNPLLLHLQHWQVNSLPLSHLGAVREKKKLYRHSLKIISRVPPEGKDWERLCEPLHGIWKLLCAFPSQYKYSIGPITENSLKKKRWIMFMASCSKYIVICHNIQKVK